MAKPPWSRYAEIAQPGSLARSGAQSGSLGPVNRRDADRRVRLGDREAAGRFVPAAASFVTHKEATLIAPHSLPLRKIGSVSAHQDRGGLV